MSEDHIRCSKCGVRSCERDYFLSLLRRVAAGTSLQHTAPQFERYFYIDEKLEEDIKKAIEA